jgi:hypothetical protein
MIFAEMDYEGEYQNVHEELVSLFRGEFLQVESGLQGDSWIWVLDGSDKVAIDTFTSMKHQIKSSRPGAHVQKVIEVLLRKYKVTIYQTPELEGHEDMGRGGA